jgi:predicted MFS family arabinose efflux permease
MWPLFGAAAAASTLVAGPARRRWGDRRTWIASHVVMALGVAVLLVPALPAGIAMGVSAVLVGGTFMVATMAGLQEGRRVGGASARALIAAMTAAFALGQIAGPVLVSLVNNVALSLAAAVLLLVASALVLWRIP